jgi:peptidylprolyl isomerase
VSTAKSGETGKVPYTGKLKDGTQFDSSQGSEPLQIELGTQQVIPGFEDAVIGMSVGESKTAEIPVDKAYGPRREEMIAKVDRSQYPDDLKPEVGQTLGVQQQDGESLQVVVVDVNDEGMTIDANHPLAGEDLTFEIELVEIG